MKPDVLFWFYKNFDTCRKRLERLRQFNEGIRIFALYGGPLREAEIARNALDEFVDDFYVYTEEKDSSWKHIHGEQMIASWYIERGRHLEWETIFIMQWDMLILEPLETLFFGLRSHEILLSGFTPISTVSSWWYWANPKNSDLASFKEFLCNEFNYKDELFACLFIVICYPRIFLEKYVNAGCPEVGFLEYKIPTMAHIFGIPICRNHDFEPWWRENPATRNIPWHQRVLNAASQEIPRSVILQELASSNGKRLFHPVFRILPSWMENRYMANTLSYFFQFFEIFSQSSQSMINLKRYAKDLTRRST
jgi:hypothetical protein